MCKRNGESIDHHEVARELWNVIFNLSRVECAMPRRVIELLDSWQGQVGSRSILTT
jgi:hypothetical protein